jgi:bifunctional DNA-binding transcriptional regulator/antitoxin component of YhaV-PrlF toxin-antitoxin module
VTVLVPARDGLGWQPGDEIVFRVDGDRVVLAKKTARPEEDLALRARVPPWFHSERV